MITRQRQLPCRTPRGTGPPEGTVTSRLEPRTPLAMSNDDDGMSAHADRSAVGPHAPIDAQLLYARWTDPKCRPRRYARHLNAVDVLARLARVRFGKSVLARCSSLMAYETPTQSKPSARAARACRVPLAPDRERIRLCEHYPEHGARVQVHGHRASRSSRRRRTTSSGRLGRTRRTFLRSVTGRDAGRTSKPSFSSGSYGTSRAMGVVRSQTTTDSPLRTSAR